MGLLKAWQKVNSLFEQFQNTAIGKWLLKGKSFFSIISIFGLLLIAHLTAYFSITQWSMKIEEQLATAQGWEYLGWFILSFLVPEGNILVILALSLLIPALFYVRYIEIKGSKPKRELTSIGYEEQFFGRKKELEIIEKQLNDSSSLLLLNGIGGIGKTSLANYYLQENRKKYAHVAFINGGSDIRLALFNEFKPTLKLQEQGNIEADFLEVLGKLRELDGKKLLVLDDIKESKNQKAFIEEVLKLRSHGYRLLFTSREEIEDIESYYLDVLEFEDAKKLFNSIYAIEDDKLLKEILDYIDYHTYFIEMIAKTLKNSQKSLDPKQLKHKFQKGDFSKVRRDHTESFQDLLEDLFNFETLEPDTILTLKQFSALPSIEISFDDLVTTFQIEDKVTLEHKLNFLVSRGWLVYGDTGYKLHQIIKEFIHSSHQPTFEEIERIVDTFSKTIANSGNIQTALNVRESLLFFESINELLDKQKNENEKVAQLWADLANVYRYLGTYEKAEPLYQKALRIREKLLGEEHPSTATSYNNLAGLYRAMGAFKKAEPLYQKDLAICEKLLGEEHPDTATSYNNLAVFYYGQEEYMKSYAFMQKAVQVREKVLPLEHPDLIASKQGLETILMKAFEIFIVSKIENGEKIDTENEEEVMRLLGEFREGMELF